MGDVFQDQFLSSATPMTKLLTLYFPNLFFFVIGVRVDIVFFSLCSQTVYVAKKLRRHDAAAGHQRG